MNSLSNQIVIENVLMSKLRGRVIYSFNISAFTAVNLVYVKPYDHPSGKGYQRPVNVKRCHEFAAYLSKGEDAFFPSLLVNAEGNWEFAAYDKHRPMFGRLFCKLKASLLDGQHRMGGIGKYISETHSDIQIPFLAIHCLDQDEEIRLFDTINTKARGIGSSLSKYLKREYDDVCWVATQLITDRDSPFFNIGSITGTRSGGRHITLQNMYRMIDYLTREESINKLSKNEKLLLVKKYFTFIKEVLTKEWLDYKEYRLTHIVCLDALSIAGSSILEICISNNNSFHFDSLHRAVSKLRKVDWSTNGPFRFLKGVSGSKALASELLSHMQNSN